VITYDSRNEFYTATGGDNNASAGNPSGPRRAVAAREPAQRAAPARRST
jgi:lipopolysaccharide export system protein LptA